MKIQYIKICGYSKNCIKRNVGAYIRKGQISQIEDLIMPLKYRKTRTN